MTAGDPIREDGSKDWELIGVSLRNGLLGLGGLPCPRRLDGLPD